MKNKKGITLIALIITIIVLLILAGVSISIVTGDNGVLKQAQTSLKKTNLETAKEELSMAWANCQAEYLESITKNANSNKSTYFTPEKMNEYLTGKGTVNNFTYEADGETVIVYTKANNSNEVYKFNVRPSGEIEVGTGIAVTANKTAILAGGSIELNAVLTDITGTVNWSSSSGAVSFSTTTGNTTTVTVVSGTSAGNITITATVGEEATNYTLKVVKQATGFTIGGVTVDEGSTSQIPVNTIVAVATGETNTNNIEEIDLTQITYGTPADTTKATVTSAGVVTGVAVGTTTVTVTAKGKISGATVTGTCNITVTEVTTTVSATDIVNYMGSDLNKVREYYGHSVKYNGNSGWEILNIICRK